MSWKATAVAFLLLAGCKSDCERMLEHVAHVSWQHNLATMTPEQKQQTHGMLPSEAQMMPSLREIARKRMAGRCGEPAFVACVLAARDPFAISRCEQDRPK